MKKKIVSVCIAALGLAGMHTSANAVNAASIFNNIGMTGSSSTGGVLNSQARSIYSFGGGMATAKGKKVSLMAVDPPSFNAGCSGISWHFGGFAFISAEEIRQLIEAVAQAALGVVIDLALATLCPMCHSIMDKMRALANAARAMVADSCRIAQKLGSLLQDTGIFGKEQAKMECGAMSSSNGESDSLFSAQLNSACRTLTDTTNTLTAAGQRFNQWLDSRPGAASGGPAPATGPTPSDEEMASQGNMTYKALGALGYPDGLAKNIILSSIGMAIYPAVPSKDCAEPFANFRATPVAELSDLSDETRSQLGAAIDDVHTVEDTSATPEAISGARVATLRPSDSSKGKPVCFAPPLLNAPSLNSGKGGIAEVGTRLVCGFDPKRDFDAFSVKWASALGMDVSLFKQKFLKQPTAEMCGLKATASGTASSGAMSNDNPLIYKCESGCVQPSMIRLKDALAASGTAEYSGVVWFVLDALYSGVAAVQQGTEELPPATIKILAAAEYPLFRVMNMAAVYGDTALHLLEAYSAKIATHHVEATLSQLLRPGVLPQVELKSGSGISRLEIHNLRAQIDALNDELGPFGNKVKDRLAEKQFLVDQIMQVNKAIQADIMTTGLASNSQLAVSLKKQINAVRPTTPGSTPTTP